jgi:SpoVK/Ycf46/Vps4 family AAA+-type ATPase
MTMAPGIVEVDPDKIRGETNYWRTQIKRPSVNFYNRVADRDRFGPGVLSTEANTAVQSIEKFLGTASAFKRSVLQNGVLDSLSRDKDEFVDLFSSYAGASAAAAYIDKEYADTPATPLVGKRTIDFKVGDRVLDDLVCAYLAGSDRATNGEGLLRYAKDFHQWVIAQAIEQKKNPRFEELVNKAEKANIRVNGIIINGFNARKFEAVQTKAAAYKREDYVGNKEFLETIGHSMTELMDYDFKAKKNPNLDLGGFQQTITIWGPPGMGKSMGIGIALNEAQARANSLGIPFSIRRLDEFKNEFFSKSAQNLREIFDSINKGDSVYAVVVEDIDAVFFARDKLQNRQEDKDILQTVMNQLEGFTSNLSGNYVLIATSNHPLDGDGALMDRLRQCQICVDGPQTVDDYVSVFQAKLRDGIQGGYINVKDWKGIGGIVVPPAKKPVSYEMPDLGIEHRISNRDIRNIALTALALTKNYDRPDKFYTMKYDERVAFLRGQRKPVNEAAFAGVVKKYVEGIEQQRRNDFEQDVQRMMYEAAVRQEVSKRLGGAE